MTKPCDLDLDTQDPYNTCPHCGAIPCAPCRADDLSEKEEKLLLTKLKKGA